MATHWVDGVGGSDSNDGSTYALRKQTMISVTTAMDTDADTTITLNVVASGPYTMTGAYTSVYVDANRATDIVTYRGVEDNDTETPAWVDVIAPASGACAFVSPRSGIHTLKYFDVDFSASKADTASQYFARHVETGDAGAIIVEYCVFTGTDATTAPSGNTFIVDGNSYRDSLITIRKCVISQCRTVRSPSGGSRVKAEFSYNVFVSDWTDSTTSAWCTGPVFGTATNVWTFNNNTCFFRQNLNGAFTALTVMSYGLLADCGQVDNHDNVFWVDDSGDNVSSSILYFMRDSNASSSVPSSGSRGYNVCYTGPAFSSGEVTDFIAGPAYAVDGAKGYLTDTIAYEQADTVLFTDITSTYEWTPDGSALALTVPMDLRLVAETGSGTAGALPGALDAAGTDYTVTVTADDTTPNTADTIVVTTTVDNTGVNATSVVIDVPVPAGLTYVSDSASVGTYDDATDTWTLGNLNTGASATLAITCTVDTDQQGNTINFVSTFTSGSPGAGDPTTDDTDTLPIVVNAESSYTVTTKTAGSSPKEGETATVTTNISNTGVNATGVTLSCPTPSGATYVSASATAGTYDSVTEVWTVGALNTGSVAILTLNFSIKTGQAGNSLTYTGTLLTSVPQSHPDTSDDASSEIFTIPANDPADPESPAGVPYVDTAPIYSTDLKLDLNVQMKLRKNRVDFGVLRGDIEDVRWREGSFRCINLGTNLTTKLILGGVQRGEFLILDSTTQIQISVGNDTNLYWPAKFLVLGSSDFEQVHLKNTSLTVAATVHIGVTD